MTKPNWKDAPEWAQWLARDRDGTWYWYEDKPAKLGVSWWTSRGQCEAIRPNVKKWRESLEQRPAVQP